MEHPLNRNRQEEVAEVRLGRNLIPHGSLKATGRKVTCSGTMRQLGIEHGESSCMSFSHCLCSCDKGRKIII